MGLGALNGVGVALLSGMLADPRSAYMLAAQVGARDGGWGWGLARQGAPVHARLCSRDVLL